MTNNNPVSREEALDWLVANVDEWPKAKENPASPDGWSWAWSTPSPDAINKVVLWCFHNDFPGYITREHWLAAQSKIDTPVWDGNGLPSVGTECEYAWGDDDWEIGHIEYLSEQTVVITHTDGAEDSFTTGDVKFRPIKSEAEQRRDDAIAELNTIGSKAGSFSELLAAIYDAGWRKLEDSHDSNG